MTVRRIELWKGFLNAKGIPILEKLYMSCILPGLMIVDYPFRVGKGAESL